jgi:hypothetical protein
LLARPDKSSHLRVHAQWLAWELCFQQQWLCRRQFSMPQLFDICWHKCPANKHAEGPRAAPLRRHRSDRCVSPVRPLPTGQTGGGHWLDLWGVNRRKTSERHPGRIPSGRRT